MRRSMIVAGGLLLAATPAAADTLLIGNKGENTVSFVDLATGRERARVETASMPHEVAVSPDGKQAAVVSYGGTTIDVFDVKRAERLRRIELAPNVAPHGIVWLRNGRLAVTTEKSRSVAVVDPAGRVIHSIGTEQNGSHMIALSPDQRRGYVANIGSGTVSVVDLARGAKIEDIAVGGMPEGIAITKDGRHLWVGDNSGPRVRVVELSTRKIVATLPTDPVAIRVAISPDGKTAITSNIGAGTLSLFDVASMKPLRTITVGDRGAGQVTIAFSRDGKRLYAAETARDTIAEVDLAAGAVLRRLPAGKNGDGLGIAP